MSCNNCNCNSGTKCSNVHCGCADTSVPMPCVYNDCIRGKDAEQCEDIQCAACVSYCSNTFSTPVGNEIFTISTGERLDRILQRIALFMSNPSCITTAPQLVYIETTTNNSVTVGWSGVPNGATVSVEYRVPGAAGYQTAVTGLNTSVTQHEITNLLSNQVYEIRIVNGTCSSVIITAETLI